MSLENIDRLEIPIFPLPNCVLFPSARLPLHIFEPRYRLMVSENLATGGLMGIMLLRGPEDPTGSGIDSFEVGGAGKITRWDRLEDGRYNIVLTGVTRFRIQRYVRFAPFRTAQVELLPEEPGSSEEARILRRRLLQLVRQFGQPGETSGIELDKTDFFMMVNSLCSLLPLGSLSRQTLLELDSMVARAEVLVNALERTLERRRLIRPFEKLRPEDPRVN